MLPWTNESPAQISIEWDKNPYYQTPAHYGTMNGGNSTVSSNGPHFHDPRSTSRSHSPVPSAMTHAYPPNLANHALPVHTELTQGTIYIGISGYFE